MYKRRTPCLTTARTGRRDRRALGRYKATATKAARERLILHYSPLVKFVAGRVAAGLPQNIEQSDLVSYGIFGLIDAIDKFDPGRGFKFETYAISRIKGAIIDELRSIDWVPRSVRAKARAIERAYSKLENELQRSPDDDEVAAELGMTEDELADAVADLLRRPGRPRRDARGGLERTMGGATVGDTIADGVDDPVAGLRGRRDAAHARRRDQPHARPRTLVLTLYYYEGLTLAEIGAILGVTESRVCQIHTKAILQLRARMVEPDREPGPVR